MTAAGPWNKLSLLTWLRKTSRTSHESLQLPGPRRLRRTAIHFRNYSPPRIREEESHAGLAKDGFVGGS